MTIHPSLWVDSTLYIQVHETKTLLVFVNNKRISTIKVISKVAITIIPLLTCKYGESLMKMLHLVMRPDIIQDLGFGGFGMCYVVVWSIRKTHYLVDHFSLWIARATNHCFNMSIGQISFVSLWNFALFTCLPTLKGPSCRILAPTPKRLIFLLSPYEAKSFSPWFVWNLGSFHLPTFVKHALKVKGLRVTSWCSN